MAKKKVDTADEAGLLQAIRTQPEEDTPRLVYADWLDENGRPERAEFIRVQCRLARSSPYDPEWPDLRWRHDRLLTDARKREWGELPVKPVKEKCFRRGFVDTVSLYAALFLQGADRLFAQIPLRTVRLLKIGAVWDELLRSPHLLRLRGLDLHHSALSEKRCRALAACDRLVNLSELNLGANPQMRAGGLGAILNSRYLGNLRRLDLNNNGLGDDALAAFVGNANFPHLRHLDLSNNGIGPAGVGHLARAGWLSQLERLDLSGNPLGDEGVRRLADSGVLAGHTSLRVPDTEMSVTGVRSLVNSPHLSGLTELIFEGRPHGDFLGEVARSATLTKLRVLDMGGTGVGRPGVSALVRSPLAARLRALRLNIHLPAALKLLLAAPSLSGLIWLEVWGFEKDGERIDTAGLLHSAVHLKRLSIT